MRYHGEEYAEAFQGADDVLITRMYAAEERPIDGIDTPWFVDVLRTAGNRATTWKRTTAWCPGCRSGSRRGTW
ncbi:MAG: hypothetical protein R3F60_31155 [bacterium]